MPVMIDPAPGFPEAWTQAVDRVFPGPAEIVLILTSLDVEPARLEELRATFSPREHARYQSFAHDEHRFRWGAARGALREVLGRALSCSPAAVELRTAAHGKPQVAGSPLRFNISHSGARALIALGLCEVGVDIELPRARRTDDIARRFYAPGENERLFALGDAPRADAFFRLWTCKEAFLKATGEGLSRSTRSFEIELREGRARLLWARGIAEAESRYSVHPLEPGEPYRAALVAEDHPATLRLHRWP
jgi:4'-phosphopantetheinyl transferase